MAINNNDDVQSQINNLNNNVKKLTDTVNNLSRTLADSTRASKKTAGEISHDISKTFLNKITLAIKEGLSSAKDKSNDKFYTKKGELRDNKQINKIINNFAKQLDESLEEQKILLSSYNKDHKNNPEEDLTKVYEACKILVPSIKEWGESLNLSKDTIKGILQEAEISKNLNATKEDKITISDFRQVIKDELGNVTGVLNTGGPFAVPKEDAKKLSQELANVSNQLKQTQDIIKVTNDVVLDLATNSDTVNKIMLDMNVNMEMANDNLRIFNMLLDSASNAQWKQETSINNNVQAMGQMRTVMLQMQASMHQLTNANIVALQNLRDTLNAGGSPQGSNNTFQQQATRNSDRAKQAGFIALLIPALAKLLQKTPITDFLRYLALRLGSGFSGKGEHPVLGTLGLGAATLVPAALTTKWASKLLFGKNAVFGAANTTNAAKGSIGKIPWNQLPKYAKGMVAGATSTHLDRIGANVDRVGLGMGEFAKDNAGNYLFDKRGNRILTSKTGNVAGGLGYERGRLLSRNLARQTKVGVGRIAQRVPILGTAISAAFEIPDLIKAHKSGDKRIMGAQVAKSVGGVTGGTVGAIAGGALGSLVGPIGTIVGGVVGGVLGDFVGRHLGSFFRTIFTGQKEGNKLFNTFGETMVQMAGLQAAEHPILTKVLDIINPVPNLMLWIWNKIKGWTFGGESNSNGGAAKDKADKESNKLVEDVENKSKELDNFKIGNKEFDKLWKKYEKEYENAQKHKEENFKKGLLYGDKEIARDKEILKYDSSRSYAANKMVQLKKEKEHELNVSKSNLSNAVNIDKDQLVNANDLYTWSKAKVEEELKKRTGAYEKLNDKKGYWTVNHGSFITDVEYAGKGTQNKLQRMVDDHVLPAGFSITSAMGSGEINKVTGKKGHSKTGGHYNPLGNAMDITYSDKKMWEVAMNGGVWNGVKYTGLNNAKGTYLKNVIDERAGKAGNKYARMGENTHLEFATTTLTDSVKAFQAEEKAKEQAATKTITKEETASSQIREGLADIVGAKNKSDKQEKARSVIFSAVDVTGSLGVWGITQLNNGVMRTGR